MLIDRDPAAREATARVLRPLVGELLVADAPIVPAGDLDLVVASYDELPAGERGQLLARYGNLHGRPRLLLLSAGQCDEEFQSLFSSRKLTNVLARNGQREIPDLGVTVEKLLRPDPFGLARYFGRGAQVVTTTMTRSSERERILGDAAAYARSFAMPARLAAHFRTVADELVTNAIYNAPRDERGGSRFAHVSRSDEVALSPGEEVQIAFCSDGRRLGISVGDPFGSLTPEMLVDYLGRCFLGGPGLIENKPGGAGLGLFYIFNAVSHLAANLRAGQRTEMIGLIDLPRRYRDFAASHKSFNIFTG